MRNPRERIRKSRGYKWGILSLVMLGTFMAVMDVTVVNVGLPTIMSVFHIPISTAEWVITAYMITMTLMLPSAGWIADRIGALCQGYVVDVQVAAVVFDPYPVVGVDPVERFAVVGLCPEKNGFHGVYFI